jgi:hypothetical protein
MLEDMVCVTSVDLNFQSPAWLILFAFLTAWLSFSLSSHILSHNQYSHSHVHCQQLQFLPQLSIRYKAHLKSFAYHC